MHGAVGLPRSMLLEFLEEEALAPPRQRASRSSRHAWRAAPARFESGVRGAQSRGDMFGRHRARRCDGGDRSRMVLPLEMRRAGAAAQQGGYSSALSTLRRRARTCRGRDAALRRRALQAGGGCAGSDSRIPLRRLERISTDLAARGPNHDISIPPAVVDASSGNQPQLRAARAHRCVAGRLRQRLANRRAPTVCDARAAGIGKTLAPSA